MRLTTLVGGLLWCFVITQAGYAQYAQRVLPKNAQIGTVNEVTFAGQASVTINGTRWPLAVGARIRDEYNRIVLPAQAVMLGKRVAFLTESTSRIKIIWLLTPPELGQFNRSYDHYGNHQHNPLGIGLTDALNRRVLP